MPTERGEIIMNTEKGIFMQISWLCNGKLKQLLQRCGYIVHQYTPFNSFELQRQRLLEFYGIGQVVDGGANIGQYAETLREHGYRGSILSIEPNPEAFRHLSARAAKTSGWRVYQAAVGEAAGEAILNVTANSFSSSLLVPRVLPFNVEAGVVVVRQESVSIEPLDQILDRFDQGQREILLKLDIQGTEAAALRGASRWLDRIAMIELELSLMSLYEGEAPRFQEMIKLVADLGFDLLAIHPNTVDPRTGVSFEVNVIAGRSRTKQELTS